MAETRPENPISNKTEILSLLIIVAGTTIRISQKPDLPRIKMSYFHNLERKKNIESSQARDKVVFFV